MVSGSLLPHAGSSLFENGLRWAVPLAQASAATKSVPVNCLHYCEQGKRFNFRIPEGAQPATGSDQHLAVLDGERELDLWKARYDATTGVWSADTVVLNDAEGWGATCRAGKHCNGAVAAGFALLGGLVRPEEMRAGKIEHALALVVPQTRAGFIACPATHTDGKSFSPGSIPLGARIQLDPELNVDAQAWPQWEKTVAKALQQYGAFVVDTGGTVAIRAISDANLQDSTWKTANVPLRPALTTLPWERMRVLKLQPCD